MKRNTSIIVLLALAMVFCGWYFEDVFLTAGYAPSFRPGLATTSETSLLIKNRNAAGDGLLLRPRGHEDVFLYDVSKKLIQKVNSEEWEQSDEKELICFGLSDEYSGSSYGHYVLTSHKSPDNTRIAVVSAYGPRAPEVLSFPGLGGGEGRIMGTRYLEVRKLPENELVGRPVRIDLLWYTNKPDMCWSDQAKFIVVSYEGTNFSVVENPAD